MEITKPRYPIGIQTFSEIRERGLLYVDKTAYVYRMTHDNSKYQFLSRPRRFGKSLLTSTLKSYFEGKKELFKGLAIEKLETEWTVYPVLHFDMSRAKHVDKERLESMLNVQLYYYEKIYGREEVEKTLNDRMEGVIKRACQQTGQKAVVLIDEYDAPLLDVVHEDTMLPVLRNVMRNFYSPLKACDPYLRFVFLTGITKFSQLSIFSELNNMENISMDKQYAAICGITEEEMRTQMSVGLDWMAQALDISPTEVERQLKEHYDGYHFTWPSPDTYNPFSLLTALAKEDFGSYWFGSGTPTYLIEMLRKYHVAPQQIGERKVPASAFDAPTERMTDITPLLYQSGYVTIKDYNRLTHLYTLDIPNKEVRLGLMESLLPNYLHQHTTDGLTTLGLMYECLYNDDMDGALQLLQTFLSTIPYCDNTDYEGHYQQMLYVIFSLLGQYVDIEVRTPKGRVDMVMRTHATLYIVELKVGKSAQAAMRQIDLKEYPSRFALCGLPTAKVGINFNCDTHTLDNWEIEKAKL